MSVQKRETADRSRRDAAYPMEVVTLDAGRTSYLSAEEAARLDRDRAQGAPHRTPGRAMREGVVR